MHIVVIAGAGIRLHKVGVIVNALPTSTVHPGCTVDLGSNNTALVIVRPRLICCLLKNIR